MVDPNLRDMLLDACRHVFGQKIEQRIRTGVDEDPGERLARSLEGLGPVAIKLGQLLSTRADIFGETQKSR